jgi:hypothetical protein
MATVYRAFIEWLDAGRSRLKIPVEVTARTERQIERRALGSRSKIELSFVGIGSAIGASLTNRELSIFVEWEERIWDLFLSLDVVATARNGRIDQGSGTSNQILIWYTARIA